MTRRAGKPVVKTMSIENVVAGTVLHLGDGRRLSFGERAIVRDDIAKLIDPSQAKTLPR